MAGSHDTDAHGIGRGEIEGFATRELSSGTGLRARFVPAAGMICASLEHRDVELLGQRRGLMAWADEGKTLGIPLLHPWANRLARDGFAFAGEEVAWPDPPPGVQRDANGRPIHGVMAGARDWQVEDHRVLEHGAGLVCTLDYAADPARRAVFPFAHRLTIEAVLAGSSLRMATRLEATGDRPVPVAFGWHPYLTLPGVPRQDWHVELPVTRRAVLDAGCLPSGAHEPCRIRPGPLGDRSYDDLFDRLEPGVPFVLEGGGRRIELLFGPGYEVAVVYAPRDDDVVCFEPMTAPTNPFDGGAPPRSVAPGERFEASFSLTVRESAPEA